MFQFEELNKETGQLETSKELIKLIVTYDDCILFYFTSDSHKKIKNITFDSTDLTINREDDSVWVLLDRKDWRPNLSKHKKIQTFAFQIDDIDLFFKKIGDYVINKIKIPDELQHYSNDELVAHLLKFNLIHIVDIVSEIQYPGIDSIHIDTVDIINNIN